jgi:hypothetical protein
VIKDNLYQQISSRFLIALKKYYLEQNKNVPIYIANLENMCLDVNEFSEIRNIWINDEFN